MDVILQEIINRIVEEADPDKVVLFGSRARNHHKDSSDYDICVLKQGFYHKRKLRRRLYSRLFGVGAAVDIIVETPEKFSELKAKSFLIYADVEKHGEVIYEKQKTRA
jgi:predicted nucleotidyltransferase